MGVPRVQAGSLLRRPHAAQASREYVRGSLGSLPFAPGATLSPCLTERFLVRIRWKQGRVMADLFSILPVYVRAAAQEAMLLLSCPGAWPCVLFK